MTDDIIDLSEDISELWDFMPLNAEDLYPSFLLQNCILRQNTEFYNNATLNICHFYNYILHTFLCRLYLADEAHIELLKYIQVTKEVFSGKDGRRRDINVCCESINLKLFNEIEKEAINYFFHLLKFDKTHQIAKTHQEIIDIRNSVAHLNYISIRRDLFLELIKKIKKNLAFISEKLYHYTKTVFYEELDGAVRKNLMDNENYIEYMGEMNKKHYFSPNDYRLAKINGLLKAVKENSYKYFIQKYIDEELLISEQ